MLKYVTCVFIFLFCVLSVGEADAQSRRLRIKRYQEIGGHLVATNYSGDLAEDNILLIQTRVGLNGFYRYHLSKNFMLRGNLGVSMLYGDDKHSPTHVWRSFRYTNTVLDLGAFLELNFVRKLIEPANSKKRYYVMVYGYGGPSVVLSRPKPEYYGAPNNPYIDRNFPGEGVDQRIYFTPVLGGGIRLITNGQYSIGLDGSIHPVIDDWLDGVSSYTGDPKDMDWYYKFGLTFTYFLKKEFRPDPGEY
jgi:OmpA-OmpF porin, OOP family